MRKTMDLPTWRREQISYNIWADAFLANLRRAGSLTLASRYLPGGMLATVARDGELPHYWRLTTYRPDGPSGHTLLDDGDLAFEVYHAWRIDPDAPARLDAWTQTAEWRAGMERIDLYSELKGE